MVNVKPLMSPVHPEDKVTVNNEIKPCTATADDNTKDLIEIDFVNDQKVEKIKNKKRKNEKKSKKNWIKRILNII